MIDSLKKIAIGLGVMGGFVVVILGALGHPIAAPLLFVVNAALIAFLIGDLVLGN